MDQQQCSRGSAVDETPREQGSDGNQIEVLAQLPDLEQRHPEGREKTRPDGRILSQKMSIKLLVGGAVVLVLAAILAVRPGGKDSKPKPGEWRPAAPAPDADEAPPFGGATAETPGTHPAWKGQVNVLPAAKNAAWREPAETPSVDISPIPVPPAMADRTQPPGADSPAKTRENTFEAARPSPAYRGSYRPQPNEYRPRATTNRPMSIGNPAPERTQGYRSGYRRPQPGIATLEGIIAKPPVRTSYERSGSGVY